MTFRAYTHLEKLGKDETDGILYGKCHIFPKIDGTNASIWYDIEAGHHKYGSRTRQLSLDHDNAGFMSHLFHTKELYHFYKNETNQRYVLYGEWLVPHTLKTYRDDAWRTFYIFDVYDLIKEVYVPYDEYKDLLLSFGLIIIPPLAIIDNPTDESLLKCLNNNTFLIKDGCGYGEGIVIKNYTFTNKFGRVCFAKLVSNEFKSNHIVEMGAPQISIHSIESSIVFETLTVDMLSKTYAKLILEQEWSSALIPKLLGTAWYDFINEEVWDILKKYKNPKIDFKRLNGLFIRRVKDLMPTLF